MGTDSRGASLQQIYRDGEGSTQHRGVLLDLMGQFQFTCPADGDGRTEYTTSFTQHEIHLLGSDGLCCRDEVAFVLSVFVIHHDDELALSEVLDGFLDMLQIVHYVSLY